MLNRGAGKRDNGDKTITQMKISRGLVMSTILKYLGMYASADVSRVSQHAKHWAQIGGYGFVSHDAGTQQVSI